MKTLPTQNRLLLFCVLLCLTTTAAARAADDGVVVKFELLKSGHIAVPVKINGREGFRMGFDTGSPMTFVTTRVASQLNLGVRAGRQIGAATMPGGAATVLLEIGDLKIPNARLAALDHPTVKQISDAQGGLDGLIGFSTFTRYDLTIDYETKELVFRPRGARANSTYRMPTGRAAVLGITLDQTFANGLRVASVAPGSAAEQGGLREGDVILTVGGRYVWETQALLNALAALAPGIPAQFKVLRDGKELNLKITARPGL